jgi:hypothetical protein
MTSTVWRQWSPALTQHHHQRETWYVSLDGLTQKEQRLGSCFPCLSACQSNYSVALGRVGSLRLTSVQMVCCRSGERINSLCLKPASFQDTEDSLGPNPSVSLGSKPLAPLPPLNGARGGRVQDPPTLYLPPQPFPYLTVSVGLQCTAMYICFNALWLYCCE